MEACLSIGVPSEHAIEHDEVRLILTFALVSFQGVTSGDLGQEFCWGGHRAKIVR